MNFGHEKLDVYRLAREYVGWGFEEAKSLDGKFRHARGPWIRANQSIPLNIAELGNLKRKEDLDRMAAMLTRLGGRGHRVSEKDMVYETKRDADRDNGSMGVKT